MVIPPRLGLELLERSARTVRGGTFTVADDNLLALLPALEGWAAAAGHRVIAADGGTVTVRCGPSADPLADLSPDRIPGTRVWIYTNFDCNLSCDYCCTESSPRAPRRALGLDRVRRIAVEAAQAGVRELVLTGGEPFLLPDLDELVAACSAQLPTTVLTNGTLLQGPRLARLRRMDPARVRLQVSLDSATPAVHERHRGPRSWERAVAGIRIATGEGFRVRVAATLVEDDLDPVALFALLDELGIAPQDRVLRRLARQGFASRGLRLDPETLVPEIAVTDRGVHWHPVGVGDPDQFVTAQIFPLAAAIELVRARFVEHRAHADSAADWFPCA